MTNETPVPLPPLADTRQQLIAAIREHTRRALAQVGLRLTRNLAARFSADNPPRATGLAEPTRDALLPAPGTPASAWPSPGRSPCNTTDASGWAPGPAGTSASGSLQEHRHDRPHSPVRLRT